MDRKKRKNSAWRGKPEDRPLTPREVCGRMTDWYMCAVLGFFPLMFGTGTYGYANIIETKALVWLLLTGLWAAGLAGALIWGRRKRLPVRVRFGWGQWAAVVFWAVHVLSAAFSQRPMTCFFLIDNSNTNSVLLVTSYAAAFLGVSLFGRFRRKHVLALAVSVSLSGAVSLLQLCGLNPLELYPDGLNYYNKHREYVGAFLGTMGNIDHLAAFLCLAIPVLTAFGLRSQRKRDRLLLIPAALSLAILYFIDVDAAKVGLLGCPVLAVPVLVRGRRAAKWAGVVCGFAIFAGLAAVYFWPGTGGFLWEASRILHGDVRPSFGHDRVEIWMEALRYVRARPLLGFGPGSGTWLFQDIQKVNEEMGRVTSVFNVHNVYLGYLVESGVFALGSYLAVLVRAWIGWVRGRADDAAAALGAGLCCYLIQDFFALGLVTTAPVLWVGLGALAGSIPGGTEGTDVS